VSACREHQVDDCPLLHIRDACRGASRVTLHEQMENEKHFFFWQPGFAAEWLFLRFREPLAALLALEALTALRPRPAFAISIFAIVTVTLALRFLQSSARMTVGVETLPLAQAPEVRPDRQLTL
jgi:hypothetical protein